MEEKAKRYVLFAGESYYPAGGWRDFVASSDVLSDVTPMHITTAGRTYPHPDWEFRGKLYDWFHIIDIHSFAEVLNDDASKT